MLICRTGDDAIAIADSVDVWTQLKLKRLLELNRATLHIAPCCVAPPLGPQEALTPFDTVLN